MQKLDKIKSIVAFVLLALVLVPFVYLGKEHPYTRTAAAFAIIAWLLTMFIVNRLKRNGDQ